MQESITSFQSNKQGGINTNKGNKYSTEEIGRGFECEETGRKRSRKKKFERSNWIETIMEL